MFKDTPEGETHCDLVADAKQRALDLYKPPFRYFADIWTVGSEDGSGATVCKVDDHADGELISEALTEYYAKRQKCAVHGYGCGMQEATCQSI